MLAAALLRSHGSNGALVRMALRSRTGSPSAIRDVGLRRASFQIGRIRMTGTWDKRAAAGTSHLAMGTRAYKFKPSPHWWTVL